MEPKRWPVLEIMIYICKIMKFIRQIWPNPNSVPSGPHFPLSGLLLGRFAGPRVGARQILTFKRDYKKCSELSWGPPPTPGHPGLTDFVWKSRRKKLGRFSSPRPQKSALASRKGKIQKNPQGKFRFYYLQTQHAIPPLIAPKHFLWYLGKIKNIKMPDSTTGNIFFQRSTFDFFPAGRKNRTFDARGPYVGPCNFFLGAIQNFISNFF